MALCPSCGSARLRNGYRTAPFPLRLIGIRTLLCDHCNYEFRAFSPFPPKSSRHRHQKRKADVFNSAPAVDLHALAEVGSSIAQVRRPPAPIPFNRAELPQYAPPVKPEPSDGRLLPVTDLQPSALTLARVPETVPPANLPSLPSEDDADFVPPPQPMSASSLPDQVATLRERLVAQPAPATTEEPLLRLKEDLEERRSHAAQYTCPACGSHEVARRHRNLWERLLSMISSVRPYRCERCRHRFHARRQTHQPSVAKQREAEFLKDSCFNQTEESK